MVTKKITGIILSLKHYGEWDRIITLLSEEYGRILIIAKGVKKITSERGCHLDLFNEVSMEVEESKTALAPKRYLREVSIQRSFQNMKKRGEGFAAACVIASFINHMLPEGTPQKTLFRLTKKGFEALDEAGRGMERQILLAYFLKAVRELGYLPARLPRYRARAMLWKILAQLDPEFTLNARRTLGIFSKRESTRSN